MLLATWNKDDVREVSSLSPLSPRRSLHSISEILQLIGVKNDLELRHIQVVLEQAHTASNEDVLDINTENCVKLTIEKLASFLNVKPKPPNAGNELSPLYLPDSSSVLRPSKSLLYADALNYWGDFQVDLSNVPYSYFNITIAEYKIGATNFCRLLPDSVRPIGLSTVCRQQVSDSTVPTSESQVAKQLTKTLAYPEIPDGIVLFVNRFLGKQNNEEELKDLIGSYLKRIEIVTVENLELEIVMTEYNVHIGTLDTSFCYIPGEENSTLYLDSLSSPTTDDDDDDDVYLDVATHMFDELCKTDWRKKPRSKSRRE